MNTNIITCPNCNTQFEPTAALEQSIKESMRKEFNGRWEEEVKKREEQYKQREILLMQQNQEAEKAAHNRALELQRDFELQRKKIEEDAHRQAAVTTQADFEHKLKLLEETNKANADKLKEARDREMDFLKKMEALQAREAELEVATQRKLMEERTRLSEQIRKEEDEKNKVRDADHQMRLKELEKQLDDQRKLAEEMRRKAEQGSMQLQGEVQELALEALLKHTFPFDIISEVGKGVKGADCIQTVRNNYGQECGKIIYESKRTKDFSPEWIEKLKADSRMLGADVAVIVTQAMPKDMPSFGQKDGVWICNFTEAKALIHVLRDLVVQVHSAHTSHDNKGDKMALLYNYLISAEFAGQWDAIREAFMSMKMSLIKERDQMERIWKSREKQLEKVLLSATHIRGSIDGIAGMESIDLNLLPEDRYTLE